MFDTEDRSRDSGLPAGRQVYELGYLVLPSIPEDNIPGVVDSIKKIIAQIGGKELDGETPFRRKLAYSMSKVVGSSKYVVDDAYLGWLKFELEPSRIGEIKAEMEKFGEVLRFLLIKAPRETLFTFESIRKAAKEAREAKEIEELAEAAEGGVEVDSEEDMVQ